MPRVPKADWKPHHLTLEPAADKVVRSGVNTLVVAGPGAGKTELLAQRACYLLETGECSGEQRILAISLKRDAARNLEDRVRLRCGRELAHRFHSMTFDAFAKGLVDRFRVALPTEYQPTVDCLVSFEVVDYKLGDLVRALPAEFSKLSQAALQGIAGKALYWKEFLGRRLVVPIPTPKTVEEQAAADLWQFLLRSGGQSAVGFGMFGRLAELLLRSNPAVLSALRSCYSYVFLDEFQDTTTIHYELTKTAFLGSEAVLTAVGDNKQRVMGFAGAMRGVFDAFVSDFGAVRTPLSMNYRSTKELVRIQAVFAKAIDKGAVDAVAADNGNHGVGECRVLEFSDAKTEAERVADLIATWIQKDGVPPEDICVLTRLRKPGYTQQLQEELLTRNVASRVENELQDLLNEPLTIAVVGLLALTVRDADPVAWTQVTGLLHELSQVESGRRARRMEEELAGFVNGLASTLRQTAPWTEESATAVVTSILKFLGEEQLRMRFPQYRQGAFFAETVAKLGKLFSEWLATMDWVGVVDSALGIGFVPIMTMHKSKGLEYDTVVFVGLEDGALFSFRSEAEEETCGFFVALSRAKRRAIFTFAGIRPVGRGGKAEVQGRKAIEPLYQLLNAAGVAVEKIV